MADKSLHNMDENLYKLLTWFTGIVINANDMIPFLFVLAPWQDHANNIVRQIKSRYYILMSTYILNNKR